MRPREDRSADLGIGAHPRRRHQLDRGGALLVPELADVEVSLPAVRTRGPEPAEEDVACSLGQALALDHALPLVVELGRRRVGLEHRWLGLLDLKEQRVTLVVADEAARSRPEFQRCRRRQPCARCGRADRCRAGVDDRGGGSRDSPRATVESSSRPSRAACPRTSARAGRARGGSLRIRSSPSIRSVSFEKARSRSLRRALATLRSNALRSFR